MRLLALDFRTASFDLKHSVSVYGTLYGVGIVSDALRENDATLEATLNGFALAAFGVLASNHELVALEVDFEFFRPKGGRRQSITEQIRYRGPTPGRVQDPASSQTRT